MNESEQNRLLDLAAAYIDDALSDEQAAELEELLDEHPENRRAFTDFLHDHATLHWDRVGNLEENAVEPFAEKNARQPVLLQTVAAVVALSLVAILFLRNSANSFATMTVTESATWQSGDLPTSDGARLGPGTLRLAAGLATVTFDSGAEVILEAPAELRLVDAMNCVLQSGTAVAEVEESAHGFTIATPTANVIDHGTRFAVNVNANSGATQTQVFDGLVEVALPASERSVRLEKGQRNYVAGDELGDVTAGPLEATWTTSEKEENIGPGWRYFTTGQAGGADGYVAAMDVTEHSSNELLLLKNSSDAEGPHRKSYLRFDLSRLGDAKIESAELQLHFTPTGWGLASLLGDSEFEVYAILDPALDSWNRESLTWENAPANILDNGNELDTRKAVSLGTFTLPRGTQSGMFRFHPDSLAEFLEQDENRIATLAIVRNSLEHRGGGLVHGVASKRHPTLPAPKLAVKIAE